MSNELVSVIVVAGGSADLLKACLDSVLAQSYGELQVLVVDNSSQPSFSGSFLKSHPQAVFLSPPETLGYSASLNTGIRAAKGGYILCLNDDTLLDRDFISKALRGFTAGPRIGMVSAKVLRFDRSTIDSTGLYPSIWRSARERGYGRRDRGQFDKPGYVFCPTGAAAFYRREMLDEVKEEGGYFDEGFAFFYEDLDIGWRANNAGWKCFYLPEALVYHFRGATARSRVRNRKAPARLSLSDSLHLSLITNRYRAIIKNESIPGLLLHAPFIAAYDLCVLVYLFFFRIGMFRFLPKAMKSCVAEGMRKRRSLGKRGR